MIKVYPFEQIEMSFYKKRSIAITNIDEIMLQRIQRSFQGIYEMTYHLIYKGEIVETIDAKVSKEATYKELDEIDQKYIRQVLLTQASKPSFVQFIKEVE